MLTLTPTESASLPCEVLREMEPQPKWLQEEQKFTWSPSPHFTLKWGRYFFPEDEAFLAKLCPVQPGSRIGSATVQSVEPVKVDSKWFWKIRVTKGE